MDSKVTVSVEGDASHSVNVSLNDTSTGTTYDTRKVDAGKDETFSVKDGMRLVIDAGPATPEAEEPASTKKTK